MNRMGKTPCDGLGGAAVAVLGFEREPFRSPGSTPEETERSEEARVEES